MVYEFSHGEAAINPDTLPSTSAVFKDVVAEAVDGRLTLEIGQVVQDVEFDEAKQVADQEWLQGQVQELEEAISHNAYAEIPLTSAERDSHLRGFGGGMMTVIRGEDSTRVVGPMRDGGPIDYALHLDIEAGRTMTPATVSRPMAFDLDRFDDGLAGWERAMDELRMETVHENWLELISREWAEEVVPIAKGFDRDILMVASYGSPRLDGMAQYSALQEVIDSSQDPGSNMHRYREDGNIGIYPLPVAIQPPKNPARIVSEVNGEEVVFDAGIAFEVDTSSIEAFNYAVVQEDHLSDNYVFQDTEGFPTDDGYVHLDREVWEIDIETGETTVYQGGELKWRYEQVETDTGDPAVLVRGRDGAPRLHTDATNPLEVLLSNHEDRIAENYTDDRPAHYGQAFTTVKMEAGLSADNFPYDAPAVDPLFAAPQWDPGAA